MPSAIAAPGDGTEDPLAVALVVAPTSAEHAVERYAVAEGDTVRRG